MNFQLKSLPLEGRKLKTRRNMLTRFAVCVCLFAVFLIYFAPLFSQISNALSPHSTMMPMGSMSMDMPMSSHIHDKMLAKHSHHQTSQESPVHAGHHGHHNHGENANLLEACGYCSLLFHLNWIDAKTFELIPLIPSPYPNIVTIILSHKYDVPITSIQPRAPPAIS
ncbi:MAG: DUF2946 domain-containing protein [Oceanospirillaceae bacterium]|nr:DUF2946 domain-containing protein [Oceanospirillaceae bacterium]